MEMEHFIRFPLHLKNENDVNETQFLMHKEIEMIERSINKCVLYPEGSGEAKYK
jgi:hypothetical protein